jgi:peptide/nickel transport system substrate-binding protein
VSYQRGGNFVVTRNDDYWGVKAEIREVIFRKVTEEAARVAALEAGQADVINNVPIHDVPRLERHPSIISAGAPSSTPTPSTINTSGQEPRSG